jgi:SAM-dependent methyltransferase
LAHCNNCNFSFNASFDEAKIVYDEEYDNAVPSKLFADYYLSIGEYLYKKYNLENGIVYDIGCGKGTFLKMLCSLYPNIKGIGIDPSYEGDLNPMENLTFIRDFFKHEHVTDAPNLILSRHVFEHIEFPKDFLEIIREPIVNYPNVPVFIEVPDFNWIVENKTFWDLCYEHCNYFSEKSLSEVFNNSWSQLTKITKSFNDQYLWVEGIFNPTNEVKALYHPFEINNKGIYEFIDSIQFAKQKVLQLILDYKSNDYKTVVWGMATKGVIFTNNIDADATLIDFCIDINQEKQQKFSPISGHQIQSPDV